MTTTNPTHRTLRIGIIATATTISLGMLGSTEPPTSTPTRTTSTTSTIVLVDDQFGATFWYDGGAEDSGIEVYPDGSGVQYDGGQEVRTFPPSTFAYPLGNDA